MRWCGRVVAKYVPRYDMPGGKSSGMPYSDTHSRSSARGAGGGDAQGPSSGGVDGAVGHGGARGRGTERWTPMSSLMRKRCRYTSVA
jgi:hypothetical protein